MNFDDYRNDLPYPSNTDREIRLADMRKKLDEMPLSRAEYGNRLNDLFLDLERWFKDQRRAYREREAELRNKFRLDMECDLDLIYLPDAVRNSLWEYVREAGHSSGYSEVYNVALEVTPIVAAAYRAGVQAGILEMTPA